MKMNMQELEVSHRLLCLYCKEAKWLRCVDAADRQRYQVDLFCRHCASSFLLVLENQPGGGVELWLRHSPEAEQYKLKVEEQLMEQVMKFEAEILSCQLEAEMDPAFR